MNVSLRMVSKYDTLHHNKICVTKDIHTERGNIVGMGERSMNVSTALFIVYDSRTVVLMMLVNR